MRVVVVGCGLAGLSMALGLRKKFDENKDDNNDDDLEVTIVERRDNFETSRGATFGLARCGQIALKEICPNVLDHLMKIGILVKRTGAYMLPWWEVRDALLDEVRQYPDVISIRTGMVIRTVAQDNDDGVTVTFEDSDLVLKGDVLIGADGVHSFIRTHVLGMEPATPTQTFIWRGSINVQDMPDLHCLTKRDLANFNVLGQTIVTYFNFHQQFPYTIAWSVSSKADGIKEGTTTPLDVIENYVNELGKTELLDDDATEKYETAKKVMERSGNRAEDWLSSTQQSVVHLGNPSSSENDNCWGRKGRIILIGDSAHALRPASGLGGSMAFEDAVILARLLASATKKNNNYDDTQEDYISAALQAFEDRRLPRVKSISDDQFMRSEMAYKKGGMKSRIVWSREYEAWVYQGPDASIHPPPAYDSSSSATGIALGSPN